MRFEGAQRAASGRAYPAGRELLDRIAALAQVALQCPVGGQKLGPVRRQTAVVGLSKPPVRAGENGRPVKGDRPPSKVLGAGMAIARGQKMPVVAGWR